MKLGNRPWKSQLRSAVEDKWRGIRIGEGRWRLYWVTKENHIVHPLENLLSAVSFYNSNKGVSDSTKETGGTGGAEGNAMIDIDLTFPSNAKVWLLWGEYGDVTISTIDIEDRYLRAGGSFGDQKIALSKCAPLAGEVIRIDLRIYRREVRVVTREWQVLNDSEFRRVWLRHDTKRCCLKVSDLLRELVRRERSRVTTSLQFQQYMIINNIRLLKSWWMVGRNEILENGASNSCVEAELDQSYQTFHWMIYSVCWMNQGSWCNELQHLLSEIEDVIEWSTALL